MSRQAKPAAQMVTGPGYTGFILPGVPESVPAARALTRRALGAGGQADSAVTCVSELVTNAILHSRSGQAGGCVQVSLQRETGGSLLVSVTDEGAPAGQRPDRRPWGEHGRGLGIVEVLSADWGVTPMYGTGRQTWCLLAPTSPRQRRSARTARAGKAAS